MDRISIDDTAIHSLNVSGHASIADEVNLVVYSNRVYQLPQYNRFLDVSYADTLLALEPYIGNDWLVLVALRQREYESETDVGHSLQGLYPREASADTAVIFAWRDPGKLAGFANRFISIIL